MALTNGFHLRRIERATHHRAAAREEFLAAHSGVEGDWEELLTQVVERQAAIQGEPAAIQAESETLTSETDQALTAARTHRILKLVLVSDIGKALNPAQVEGQDVGAAVMGLGHTLMEQLILDERGRILNLGSLDSRIPTVEDTPLKAHSILIENCDGPGPYGAKGAGEGGILAIAAAIGSAVNEAAGVTIRDLPLTPERVWRAIDGVR